MIKPVADLYEMQFDDGRTMAFHTDAEKAVQWLNVCDGNKVQEYVKLERLREVMLGGSLAVTDQMAYAFHHALTDSPIGDDDVQDIKRGLQAVFAGLAGNYPVMPERSKPVPDDVAFEKWWEDEKYDEKLAKVQGVMFNRVKNAAFKAWVAAGRAAAPAKDGE